MEHRLDSRIEVPINVVICDTKARFNAQAKNLSRGGIYVETNAAGDLRKKSVVSIEFVEEWFSAKIPALVVETTAMSASLMFLSTSPELQSFLNCKTF